MTLDRPIRILRPCKVSTSYVEGYGHKNKTCGFLLWEGGWGPLGFGSLFLKASKSMKEAEGPKVDGRPK